jgi:chondroitin AC lyase
VFHDSVAYIFPQPASVHVSNGEATGSWRSINHQAWATTQPVKENVFSLWLDHGVKPQNASYAWIVLPATDARTAAAYSKKPAVKVLANTADLQAVQHTGLQRTGVVFYKAGSLKINDGLTLSATEPCVLMVKTNGAATAAIAVCDPTQKLSSLKLKVNARTIDVALPQGREAGSTIVVQ